jgi:lysophospholipase L1-like esterase
VAEPLAPAVIRHVPGRAAGVVLALRPRGPAPTPAPGTAVIVVGDSLVAGMPGLGAANAGRHGDTVRDVRRRLDALLAAGPERVVLLAGTNDLLRGARPARVAARYERLLASIPVPAIVISVPPMRHGMQRRIPPPATIDSLNAALRERAPAFVDLHPRLADGSGRLAASLTSDGIHLNPAGYAAIGDLIAPLLAR